MSNRICSVETCEESAFRQFRHCKLHWHRNLLFGDPLAKMLCETLFDHKIVTPSGCWEWTERRDKDGYGKVPVECVTIPVHRYVFILAVGSIPDGIVIRHTCDNPPCFRPKHLIMGTVAENNQDSVERGRKPRGEIHGMSKLTSDQVIEMRSVYAKGATTYAEVGNIYGISPQTAWAAITRKTWRHV